MSTSSEVTRREILGVAGAMAIPAIVPSSALANPRRGRLGANDRIVIANIGVGGMGRTHVPPDTAALCDVDETRMVDVANTVMKGGKRTISQPPDLIRDYRRILDRKDIDAVTIGTPDHWHAMMTVHACQAGKHVYSEKPMCRTLEEGRAMVNAARRYRRVVQIGAQGRSNPNARSACQYIRAGMIGRVTHVDIFHPDNPVTTENYSPSPTPQTLDWEMWVGPARWRPYHHLLHPAQFRWFMDLGGGQIRDRGNHAFSICNWLMNNDDYRGIITVDAAGQAQTNGMFDVPLKLAITYRFENPDWKLTWRQGDVPKTHGLWGATYHGERDSLIVIQGDNACETEQKAKDYVPPAGKEVYLHPSDSPLTATERHRANWLDCIRTGKRPATDVELGYRSCTLCIIGNIAYKLGRTLRFDSAAERFLNDEEANRMVAEPYRAGWRI